MELFAGTCCLSNAFKEKGHETYTIDVDEQFDVDWHMDCSKITTQDIIDKFGIPDVIWLGTPCQSYSVAAISHHRKKNEITGNLDGISDFAKFCDEMNWHCRKIVEELTEINSDLIYFWENPRSAFRKMDFMQGIPRYTVWYCKYMTEFPPEQRRAKPTDIFTNHPNPKFRPECKNGTSDHAVARRGMATGTQGMKGAKERSTYPKQLVDHIVDICEQELLK